MRCLVAAKTTTRGVLLGSIFKSITRLSDSKLSATAKSSVIATAIPLGSDIIHVVYGMIIYTFQSIACALLLWFTLGIRTLWIMLLTFGTNTKLRINLKMEMLIVIKEQRLSVFT